jgi:phosphatidylserine/phosphatidylglycerophosphate/cardiolipin synthase-like enzyme
LLVTFAAYKVPEIVIALQEAAKRRVRLQLVAETVEESEGKVSFNALRALGHQFADHVEVFVWPLVNRSKDSIGRHGSLHAKCAVADRTFAFVSSANLTEYALNLNIETGVLVRGGSLPAAIVDQFDKLIQRKILLRIESKTAGG